MGEGTCALGGIAYRVRPGDRTSMSVLLCYAHGALRAGELADIGGLDSEESGIVRNMHYAKEA